MRKIMRPRLAAVLGLAAVAAIAMFAVGSAAGGARASDGDYPRNQTLYTSGNQWGNIQGFNPFMNPDSSATGTVGLAYETLFRYDPIQDTYIPWLAESGSWTGPRSYSLTIRSGIQWSDGQGFTADDVAWNFELGRFASASWHDLYQQLASGGITVSGNTVNLAFREKPRYIEWAHLLWNLPMVSPTQWANVTNDTLTLFTDFFPIGTGPYVADPNGYDPSTRVVWKKNTNGWWASLLDVAPDPQPEYIIDLVNTGETNSLDGLLAGLEDLNNNYLPGIQDYVSNEDLLSYYADRPFHLSANTTWLEPNTTHEPLNDPVFRRALATAIDLGRIIEDDYNGLVLPASPTGLLPTWSKYISADAVAKYGFTYSTSEAASMLTQAGYPKDSTGMFENKDGSPINLTISVPQWWTDWEAARDIIVESARDAGIQLTVEEKDYNTWVTDRNAGNFDLVLDNYYQLSDNPWTYWNGIYHLPLAAASEDQTTSNFERYSDPAAWALVQQLDRTPPSNTAAIRQLNIQLQMMFMKDMPMIPLWYNGAWSQFTNQYWTNWPSADGDQNYVPVMWRGWLQMTGIDMIDHLQPVPQPSQ
jgi:peptide/nickel transport system substrate-binding protein